jgi:hypothetical protein
MKRSGLILAGCALALAGCSTEFWGGGATGAAGTAAAYELRSKQQMDQLQKDLEAGRIDEKEYEIRRDQIRRGSVAY